VPGPQARAAVSPVEVQATEAVITVGWGVIGGIRGHYGCPWSLLHCTHLHAYRAQTQVVAATPNEFEGVVRWRFESMAANRYRS